MTLGHSNFKIHGALLGAGPHRMVSPFPFYVVGTFGIFLGFAILHRWLKDFSSLRSDRPASSFAAAILAFLLGSASIMVGIQFDSVQLTIENTRTFIYAVTVHPNGTVPIRLYLPAPADERVFFVLDEANGTSTLRLNRTAKTPFVEVYATRDVGFIIRTEFVGVTFNRTLHHVSLDNPSFRFTSNGTAVVELIGDGSGTATAHVRLDILFVEYCRNSEFLLDRLVHEGISRYDASYSVVPCPP